VQADHLMASCHTQPTPSLLVEGRTVALVGHHNVGKSVLFQRLTGRRTTVANYPGTTVEVLRGAASLLGGATVADTPGVLTIPARTEDEEVTARLLLAEPLRAVVQVGDAKNLRRTLLLTVQLAEMGLPLVLVLNMMDEAGVRGVRLDTRRLAERLGLQVVPAVATLGQGVAEVVAAVGSASKPNLRLEYHEAIEGALEDVVGRMPHSGIAPRALALQWLGGDPVAEAWVREGVGEQAYQDLLARRETLRLTCPEPLSELIQRTRLAFARELTSAVSAAEGAGWHGLAARAGEVASHPIWGLPILAGVLYALYWFVGVFGAGTLVGLLEENLFGARVNPWIAGLANRLIPVPWLADLLVGEYGLWTMGLTYAMALILPIVATFFLAFGVLEDSGYLPRLAVLSNRLFRAMGLNGKAVVPMVLGLGCVTMATLTTRILESRRDRVLTILLLALAVPCSAQLGVVMGMLAGISFSATLIWSGVVMGVLLVVGRLASRLVPGERSALLVELPPMRRPFAASVLVKTLVRVEWYLKEVVPLFLAGTALLFALHRIGVLDSLVRIGEPLVVGWLGLPPQASAAFLMGFLRRDFGATGLFVMESQGLLSPLQVVVAMVTITLFIPCVAAVLMIARERGTRTALAVTALIFPLAFLVGGFLARALAAAGWGG
jgi:ferrous iron transport protein B